MFRKLVLVILYLLLRISSGQEIDFNICPNGLTTSPSDPQWPQTIPDRFETFIEISTDVETFEVTQLFIGSYRDVIYFHSYETDLQVYYDFQTNEMLTINNDLLCDRKEIKTDESLAFIASQIAKPSVLLGFDGRNQFNNAFFTRYIGKETIRDGISTQKFQSCFYIPQENVTINATYYISETPPNQINMNTAPDFVQIDVRSNNFPYTLNIIRFTSSPSLNIHTPSGAYCANRINTREFPKNLPTNLYLHAETYTPKNNEVPSRIESFNRLIDETLQFERVDYSRGKVIIPAPPSRLLVDYSANLTYMYTRETQQCTVTNASAHALGTTNEAIFQFGDMNNSIQFQYTGVARCGREHVQCHRWIGQRDLTAFIQQYEWFWTAKYNDFDLQVFIPIKANMKTIFPTDPSKTVSQEISKFIQKEHLTSSIKKSKSVKIDMSSCFSS
jgi:hypothetical protein